MASTFGRTAADLYNGIDDMLSDGIDALETGLADEFSSGGRSVRSGKGISKKNMTKYCDKVRQELLKRFDINIDKFEMYVTKNIYHVDDALAPVTFGQSSSSSSSSSSSAAAVAAAASAADAEREASGLSEELIASERAADAQLVEILGQLGQESRRKAQLAQESAALAAQLALVAGCEEKLDAVVEAQRAEGGDDDDDDAASLTADFGRIGAQIAEMDALVETMRAAASELPSAANSRRQAPGGGGRQGSIAARMASQM